VFFMLENTRNILVFLIVCILDKKLSCDLVLDNFFFVYVQFIATCFVEFHYQFLNET
jgi:hypothetical protein